MADSNLDLLRQLENADVISEGRIYRMRLFSEAERAALRRAIRQSDWSCAPGCAGMMDELEMVRFQAHGKEEVTNTLQYIA